MMLKTTNLSVHYGMLEAVKDVNLEIPEGKVVSLLGANGSGKSTTFKAICGLKSPTQGEIWFQDKRIDGMPSDKIVKLGISQIPEGRRLFPYMTILENLKMGAYSRKDKAEVSRDLDEVLERFPALRRKPRTRASALSGGEQEILAIARGLMARPKLLLMDEPCQGLSPIMIQEIGEVITDINQSGITIILIEHNVSVALGLAHKVYILSNSSIIFEGSPTDFSADDFVKKVYLAG